MVAGDLQPHHGSFRVFYCQGYCLSIRFSLQLRLPHDDNHILVNPFGLLYHEVTASSLVKVNLQGETIDPGTTKLGINQVRFGRKLVFTIFFYKFAVITVVSI